MVFERCNFINPVMHRVNALALVVLCPRTQDKCFAIVRNFNVSIGLASGTSAQSNRTGPMSTVTRPSGSMRDGNRPEIVRTATSSRDWLASSVTQPFAARRW